ncbi:hypothetical protein GQ53DRAFT_755166 [Thozetella sp. PMI_491]|nr:hypothetical protein GQ53DRAFT_755166 [Thozetella sp. PMI_491]
MARESDPPARPESSSGEPSEVLSEAGEDGRDGEVESQTPEICVICLEVVSEPCRAEPCTHNNFDFVCLASWVEVNSTCPLCKADVSRIRYDLVLDPEGVETSYNVYAVPQRPIRPVTPRNATDGHSGSLHHHAPRPARWAERRRSRREPFPLPVSPDLALERRRKVYRHRLFSLHIGANRTNLYRDLSPEDFIAAPHQVSRARMWLRRELRVFDFLSAPRAPPSDAAGTSGSGPANATRRIDNSEFLLEYIIAILKSVDVQGSAGQAEDMLTDFLGRDNTRLFLHELRSWLRSPHTTLGQWDREVQYPAAQVSRSPSQKRDEAKPRPLRGDYWRPSSQSGHRKRRRSADASLSPGRPVGSRLGPRTGKLPRERSN